MRTQKTKPGSTSCRQLTRLSVLETFPTTWLLHLSAFKDYVLRWAGTHYREWEEEGHIDEVGPDLSPGRRWKPQRISRL